VDEWPYGYKVTVCQPKTIEERMDIATKFKSEMSFKGTLVLDSISNSFESKFAAWPMRFYIITSGEMALIGKPGETNGYNLNQIRWWFQKQERK